MADLGGYPQIETDIDSDLVAPLQLTTHRGTLKDVLDTTWYAAQYQCIIYHADGTREQKRFTATTASTRASELATFLSADMVDGDRVVIGPGEYETNEWDFPSIDATVYAWGARFISDDSTYDYLINFTSQIHWFGGEFDGYGDDLSAQTDQGVGVKFGVGSDRSRMSHALVHNLYEFTSGTNLPYGIRVDAPDVHLTNCEVRNAGYYSIFVNKASGVHIDGCKMELNRNPSPSQGTCGISFAGTDAGVIHDSIYINNCHIEDTVGGKAGINLNAGISNTNTGWLEQAHISNTTVTCASSENSTNSIKTTNVRRVYINGCNFKSDASPTVGSKKDIFVGREAERNVLQRITTDATGGTFTISVNSATSGAIAYNASAATVETAVEAITGITAVSVSSISGGWEIEFENPTVIPNPIKIDDSSLTGHTYITVQSNPSVETVVIRDTYTSHRIELPKGPPLQVTIEDSTICNDTLDASNGAILCEPESLSIIRSRIRGYQASAIKYTDNDSNLTYPPKLYLFHSYFGGYRDALATASDALAVCNNVKMPENVFQVGCSMVNEYPTKNAGEHTWGGGNSTDRQGRNVGFESVGSPMISWVYESGGSVQLPNSGDNFAIGYILLAQSPAAGEPMAWINRDGSTAGGEWHPFVVGYLSGSGSPSGSVTPDYIGQRYLDTSGNAWYHSYGLTNTDWQAV